MLISITINIVEPTQINNKVGLGTTVYTPGISMDAIKYPGAPMHQK